MPNWNSYDEIARTYERIGAQNSAQVARDLIACAAGRMFAEGVPRVLDLGAGTGMASISIREKWPSAVITGADLSLGMLRVGKQARAGWNPAAATALALPFSDQAFDLVIANFMLSHLSQYREAVAGCQARRGLD